MTVLPLQSILFSMDGYNQKRSTVRLTAVEGMRVPCIIGILPMERRKTQNLVVDVTVGQDNPNAHSDSMDGLVDYRDLQRLVRELLVDGKFQTIEFALDQIEGALYQQFPAIASLDISIRKPKALGGQSTARVRLQSSRS